MFIVHCTSLCASAANIFKFQTLTLMGNAVYLNFASMQLCGISLSTTPLQYDPWADTWYLWFGGHLCTDKIDKNEIWMKPKLSAFDKTIMMKKNTQFHS